MPQHFLLLYPVLEQSSLAPPCIPTAWRAGGQSLNADKDFPMTQDNLRDDLSFFHHLERVMRKQKKIFKWFKAHFRWTLSCILPLVPSGTKLGWVYFPSPWLLQHLLGVSYLKLERFWRERNAKVATDCLCPICSFGIWFTLLCLVRICDTIYIQLCFLSTLTSTAVSPILCSGLGSTHAHAGQKLSTSPVFLTGTAGIKA